MTLTEVEDAGYQITDGNRIPYLETKGGGMVGRPPGGWDIDRVTANSSRVLAQAPRSAPAPLPTSAPGPKVAPPQPAPQPPPRGAAKWRPVVDAIETSIMGRGVEHAAIVDLNGKVLLPLKRGTSSSVSFTSGEVSLMRNAIVTHNHPKGYSLSAWGGEVIVAWKADASEIRAVTEINGRKVVHRLVRPQGGWAALVKTDADLRAATVAAEAAVMKTRWFTQQHALLTSGKVSPIQMGREVTHRVMQRLARSLGAKYERR